MNKYFVLALFCLVAVCSAAPAEAPAAVKPVIESLEPTIEGAEGLSAHEQDKRAILIGTTGGYRYLPEYEYRYGYPSYYRYGYPSYPTYPTYPNYPYRYLL